MMYHYTNKPFAIVKELSTQFFSNEQNIIQKNLRR